MLELDEDARAALEQSHEAGYEVSAFYGAEQTLPAVPVTFDGSLSFSASAEIQGGGTVHLARDGGESLVPAKRTDPLAPYGQELQISRTVTKGGQTWRIPLGRFRISRVPSAREYFRRYPTLALRVGWSAQLELKDRFDLIQADDFLATTAPRAGATVWDEIRRLSPIPIVESLQDAPLPAGVVYEGRSDALVMLMAHLGGVPHMTRQGALTARRSDAWLTETEPVTTIAGTIEVDDSLANDLYNSVAVTTNQDPTILAISEITNPADPLAVSSPLGRRTYTHQDPLAKTQAQAQATADRLLARLSTQQSRVAKVTCLPRPDVELGDYVRVLDPSNGKEIDGEVSEMSFSMNPTEPMTLSLIVAETR
jgi:hypothetical protein